VRKCAAELLGTTILVFFGCASAVAQGFGAGSLGVAATFGLVLMVLVYSLGTLSGCHVNPAVSLAQFLHRRIDGADFMAYVAAQILGAVMGALLLSATLGTDLGNGGLGTNFFGPQTPTSVGLSAGQAFLVEVLLTFTFVLVLLGVQARPELAPMHGLVIGMALLLVHLVGLPLTGTSVNPARSLGPALVRGGAALSQVWVFLLAPMLGALLASLTWRFLACGVPPVVALDSPLEDPANSGTESGSARPPELESFPERGGSAKGQA